MVGPLAPTRMPTLRSASLTPGLERGLVEPGVEDVHGSCRSGERISPLKTATPNLGSDACTLT